MNNQKIINKIDSFLKQGKVYIKPGEKAPEGTQVLRGKRGGQYYVSGKKGEKAKEKELRPQRILHRNIYNVVRKQPDSPEKESIMKKIKASKGKPIEFSGKEYKVIFSSLWKEVYQLAREKIAPVIGGGPIKEVPKGSK